MVCLDLFCIYIYSVVERIKPAAIAIHPSAFIFFFFNDAETPARGNVVSDVVPYYLLI